MKLSDLIRDLPTVAAKGFHTVKFYDTEDNEYKLVEIMELNDSNEIRLRLFRKD